MADSKTSALTALTEANLAGDDLLDIVDTSAVESKSIRVDELDKRYVEDIAGLTAIANSELVGGDQMVVSDAGVNKSITVTELDLRYDQSADASPLTTKGDVATYSTVDARLAVGTNGDVLTAASGETTGLEWTTPAAAYDDPLTTKGDVFTYDTDAQRLAVGANTTVLTATSGAGTGLAWAAPDPLTTKGDVFTYSTDAARFPVGSNGQVLTAASGETTGLDWLEPDPLTTKGDLFTYDTDAQRLAIGTDDFVLTADATEGTGMKWAAVDASPLTTKGDIYTYDSDDQRLAIGADDTVLTADAAEATGMKWAASAAYAGFGTAGYDPTASGGIISYHDDFISQRVELGAGDLGWNISATGSGASYSIAAAENGRPGIHTLAHGTGGGNITSIDLALDSVILGSAMDYTLAYSIKPTNIADGTNDHRVECGFVDSLTSIANGVYFAMDRSVSTTNWVGVTESGGTKTSVDSGVAFADATWVNLRIQITDSTTVEFFVNGASVGTSTTNIPSVTMGPVMTNINVTGSVSRTVAIDYFTMVMTLQSAARGSF